MHALLLLIGLLLSGGCLATDDHRYPPDALPADQVQLQWDGQELRAIRTDECYSLVANKPLPYRVVYAGQPKIVTMLDVSLHPVTIAISSEGGFISFPGWIPAAVSEEVCLLMTLPGGAADAYQGLILLGQQGQILWEHENALALSPAWGELTMGLLVASAERGNVFTPLGDELRISLLDPATGEPHWSTDPQARYFAADVELWMIKDGFALLAIQYGQQSFELVSLRLEDGALVDSYQLEGQMFYGLVFPGMFDEPIVEEDAQGNPVVRLFPLRSAPLYASLEPGTGSIQVTGEVQTLAQPIREENQAGDGGRATPGPGSEPFTVEIFPVAEFSHWTIPALVNSKGEVLVITPSGPAWLAISLIGI